MFQKEFVDRILSKKGEKKYGILSVFIQTFYKVKNLFTVNNQVFLPKPKVKSSVILLTRKNQIISPFKKELLFKCVKLAFNQRRKKLKNSLSFFKKKINFKNLPFLDKRAENLSFQEFVQLTQNIESLK